MLNRGSGCTGLIDVILLGSLTAGAYVLENHTGQLLGTFLWVMKYPALALAVLALLSWIKDEYLSGVERLSRSKLDTRESRIAQYIVSMSQEQLQAYLYSVGLANEGELDLGPEMTNIPGVDAAWLEWYLRQADQKNLQPLRETSEGSVDRKKAEATHAWLVKHQLAIPHTGKFTTRIIDWEPVYQKAFKH